jgi:TetR/AcrR family transcriptional regulator, regulator of biofilm formation and stress response
MASVVRKSKPRKRSANDPERQQRIAEAAIQVVADRGVEGLTHRAVAAGAEVPLGSTTYYRRGLARR